MFEFLSQPAESSPGSRRSFFSRATRNFLLVTGFLPESGERRLSRQKASPDDSSPNTDSSFGPGYRMRRHRLTRKITNFALIIALGAGVGWVITRQPAGGAFSVPTGGSTKMPISAEAVEKTNAVREASAKGSEEAAGPYTVQDISDVLLRDTKRGREVRVHVWYPVSAGRYPVILFSGDNPECCAKQRRHWSTYGYVVIHLTGGNPGDHREAAAIETVQLRRGKRAVSSASPIWENYPLDISFVIDSMAELQNRIPQLRRKPDLEHIGVAGRETGAFAAEVIAGAVIDLPGHPRANFADPRVRAVLCFSPQGPGHFGFRGQSFEQLVLPYLGIDDATPEGARPGSVGWRRAPFERSQAGDKYELSLHPAGLGLDHARNAAASRTDGAEKGTGESGFLGSYADSAALAFWDAYLKHDLIARRYLQSDHLEKASKGSAKLERR